jgi:hypothetical protein
MELSAKAVFIFFVAVQECQARLLEQHLEGGELEICW